jgi:serine/threonine protein phosphatase PrpC
VTPIDDPSLIVPGLVLFHPAFGFAVVRDVRPPARPEDDAPARVTIAWEQSAQANSGALPSTEVSAEALLASWMSVDASSFLHGAITRPDAMRSWLLEAPADALTSLLRDLDGPQRVRDVMDWLIGRGLFTAKVFVRWWGTESERFSTDPRLHVDGEWIRLTEQAPTPDAPISASSWATMDQYARPGQTPTPLPTPTIPPDREPLAPAEPEHAWPAISTPILESIAVGTRLCPLGVALSEQLALAHKQGALRHPYAAGMRVGPEGAITFGPDGDDLRPRRRGELASPATDIYAAGVVLVEALVGRALPAGLEGADLLPFLRHRRPDLCARALGPLAAALCTHADARPTAEEWAEMWRDIANRSAPTPTPKGAVHVGYDSHIGRVKILRGQTNQDSLYVGRLSAAPGEPSETLVVVADGISVCDAGRGDLAALLATQAISRLWVNLREEAAHDGKPQLPPARLLDVAIELANRMICERSLKAADGNLRGRMPMGTTLLLALVRGARVHLAWLGDSRAYLVGPNHTSLVTADDNLSGERFPAWCSGQLRYWNPQGHGLVRFLGHFNDSWEASVLPAHHVELELGADERLILCSDGVTDFLANQEADLALELGALAREGALDDAAARIVVAANRRGGGDNITVAVLGWEQDADSTPHA